MSLEVMGPSGFPVHLKGNAAGSALFALDNAGGVFSQISKTTPDAVAYADNDVIGAASAIWEFPNMGVAGKTSILTSIDLRIDINAVPVGMDTFRWELYNVAPTAIANNAAYDLVAGDRPGYQGYVVLSKPLIKGSVIYSQVGVGFSKPIRFVGTSIFALLVTEKAYTPPSAFVVTAAMHAIPA